ncbi:unnamed protein product, partial [marine sediment metagenome]
ETLLAGSVAEVESLDINWGYFGGEVSPANRNGAG